MNSKHLNLLALIAVLTIQNGYAGQSLKKQPHNVANNAAIEKQQYHAALMDTAIVDDSDLTDRLLAITGDNPDLVWNADKTKLLVVTWKTNSAYNDYIKNSTQTSSNPEYAVWVTLASQVKTFCHHYLVKKPKATDDQLNLRLKQYLGLPPDPAQKYDVFVELWVNPTDLFRPCVDPEINDSTCNKEIPKSFPAVKNIPDYGVFYQNLYFNRFRAANRYPWTGIGYTYDWGNPASKIGASEFILIPDAPYQIKQSVATRDYCGK